MWQPPEGNLQIDRPVKVVIDRPKDLSLPDFNKDTALTKYAKSLDSRAIQAEKQKNPQTAAYLYGVLFMLAHVINPQGSVSTLWAQVKLGSQLYECKRFWTASKLLNDAFVVASKPPVWRPATDDLFRVCLEISARTVLALAMKDHDSGDRENLIRASSNLEYSFGHLTILLGPDSQFTKVLMSRKRMIDAKIQLSFPEEHPQDVEQRNQDKAQADQKSPKAPPKPPKLPGRGRWAKREDEKGQSERDKSLLSVPGKEQSPKRPRSTTGALNHIKKDDDAEKDTSIPSHARSQSVDGRPMDGGECFDHAFEDADTGVELFDWANSYLHEGDGSTNVLQKTHQFLYEARGYPKGNKRETRRIRIAVLDTGVNLDRIKKSNKKRIQTPCCTIPEMENQGGKDESGHGTRIIQLILDIAPYADIYSYRVFKNPNEVDSSVGIVEAIEDAIAKEVDIINMSFGFQFLHPNIRKSLKKATGADILVFAAASNSGARPNLSVAWPASATEDQVFAVFATDDVGFPWKRNPPAEHMNPKFATLGEKIRPSGTTAPVDGNNDYRRPVTGTSYATPILAATAALLLDFARLEYDDKYKPFKYVDRVHYFISMKRLLIESGTRVAMGYTYVKPWLLFAKGEWDKVKIASSFEYALKDVHGW